MRTDRSTGAWSLHSTGAPEAILLRFLPLAHLIVKGMHSLMVDFSASRGDVEM